MDRSGSEPVDIASLREEYADGGLDVADLAPDPFSMFRRWFARRSRRSPRVQRDGAEHGRRATVVRRRGWCCSRASTTTASCFFTNHDLSQGRRAAANPRCALLFPWHPLERQVRIEGVASVLDRASRGLLRRRPRAMRSSVPGPAAVQPVASARSSTSAYDEVAEREDRTCRYPSSGAATGSSRRRWSSGRAGRADARPARLPARRGRLADPATGTVGNALVSECSLTYGCGRDSSCRSHVCRRSAYRPDRGDVAAAARARSDGHQQADRRGGRCCRGHDLPGLRLQGGPHRGDPRPRLRHGAVPRRPAADRAGPAAARAGLRPGDAPADPVPRHLRADDGGRDGRSAGRSQAHAPPPRGGRRDHGAAARAARARSPPCRSPSSSTSPGR